jgi:hypothetical protein
MGCFSSKMSKTNKGKHESGILSSKPFRQNFDDFPAANSGLGYRFTDEHRNAAKLQDGKIVITIEKQPGEVFHNERLDSEESPLNKDPAQPQSKPKKPLEKPAPKPKLKQKPNREETITPVRQMDPNEEKLKSLQQQIDYYEHKEAEVEKRKKKLMQEFGTLTKADQIKENKRKFLVEVKKLKKLKSKRIFFEKKKDLAEKNLKMNGLLGSIGDAIEVGKDLANNKKKIQEGMDELRIQQEMMEEIDDMFEEDNQLDDFNSEDFKDELAELIGQELDEDEDEDEDLAEIKICRKPAENQLNLTQAQVRALASGKGMRIKKDSYLKN